jgi:penicillin-binding protein 1B
VALDPKSGEIKALIGGRDYGQSQLNRALARRQPGSVFKPFVYAAAFSNDVEGRQPFVTPVTELLDSPTTFTFEGQEYTPNNYGDQFHGVVSLRKALTLSLNVATVQLAEMIGYDRVVEIAHRAGFGNHIRATPAVALGAYELTPLEVAAGYSAFANGGTRADPLFIARVTTPEGKLLERSLPRTLPALDQRVAYLMTNIMEDVLNHGTGVVVRARGFAAPAAGKTGTSHDGWFAGYTSNLLCVVWVGYDDNRELGLSGAASAAPIWAEFMKRAVELGPYRGVQSFVAPEGITLAMVDPESGELATALCPTALEESFVAGTEPKLYCLLHGGERVAGASAEHPSWLSRLFGVKPQTPAEPTAASGDGVASGSTSNTAAQKPSTTAAPAPSQMSNRPGDRQEGAASSAEPKRKSALQRFWGTLTGEKKDKKQEEKEQVKP